MFKDTVFILLCINITTDAHIHCKPGADNFDISNYECVASLLFNRSVKDPYGFCCSSGFFLQLRSTDVFMSVPFIRAFCRFEYEDVRKLAAELSGRIHPQVCWIFIHVVYYFRMIN